jgi:SepF-like predicted cell division protein (DUF552 family)
MLEPLRNSLIKKVESLMEGNMDNKEKKPIKEDFNPEHARTIKKILSILGYEDLEEFLSNNSGAVTSLLEWADENLRDKILEKIEISEESAIDMEDVGLYTVADEIRDRIANYDGDGDDVNNNDNSENEDAFNDMDESNKQRGRKMTEKKEKKPVTEKRATTFGFAGEMVKVNDLVMDISTNRQGYVKEILENGDIKADFGGRMETHGLRTFMKI